MNNRTELLRKLNEVFQDIFDDTSLSIGETTTAKDIDGWDSLTHINLLAAVEDEFDVKFNMKDVLGMKNVGEMMDLIEEQL